MKGDFSRDTFDPAKRYSRVLQQQGRVQLDADWNEQGAILLHQLRTMARDLIGAHGAPAAAPGFEIIADPFDKRLPKEVAATLKPGSFLIGPGRYYVDGILVENDRYRPYHRQTGFPFNDGTDPDTLKDTRHSMLVYLDVWERLVTAAEDPAIADPALGGADTAARAQLVWQVKVLTQDPNGAAPGCASVGALPELGGGTLRARARLEKPVTDPCAIPPDARYRGAENQLYRVEIHQGGSAKETTFTWSRENGSVLFPVLRHASADGGRLRVELGHLGRDARLGLTVGDWVELFGEAEVMRNRPEPLLKVVGVDRDRSAVTLEGKSTVDAGTVGLLLRRWDQRVGATADGVPVPGTEWVELEDGVCVRFADDKEYRTGDYWLIPARTATGGVDWPAERGADGKPVLDPDGNPVPAALPPRGPVHAFAPLALVRGGERQGDGPGLGVVRDCRCQFRPLRVCPSVGSGSGAGVNVDAV